MEAEVQAALVTATGTIVAAIIGVAGVYAILKHRKKVADLAGQVEAYYHHESALLREIYQLRHEGRTPTDSQLRSYRGKLRSAFQYKGHPL